MEHALRGRFADLALGEGLVAETLHDVERVALLTAVFVDRHRPIQYSFDPWHSDQESASRPGRNAVPQPPKITSLDDMERLPGPGSLTWLPVRHALDVRAFGCNAYVAKSAGDDVVEPHDELPGPGKSPEAGHQELYFVARGHATFTIDGERHDAPAGTYVFIPDPASHRHAVADVAGTAVLSFGGPPTFVPSPWEWILRSDPLMRSADTRDEARRILAEARELYSEQPELLYQEACLEAIAGDADAAMQRLAAAIRARPEISKWAHDDEDLATLREDPRFAELTGAR
jgi:hypothetical protein